MKEPEKKYKRMPIEEFITIKPLYFVESETDDSVLVAIYPSYDAESRLLSWWDTVKERIKRVETIESCGESGYLSFTDNGGDSYKFTPLTLEIYHNTVREKLAGKYEFQTEEEMLRAFEDTID